MKLAEKMITELQKSNANNQEQDLKFSPNKVW
jgi:hypothetical protein